MVAYREDGMVAYREAGFLPFDFTQGRNDKDWVWMTAFRRAARLRG